MLRILLRALRILRSKAARSGSWGQEPRAQDLVSENRALRILCPKAVHSGSLLGTGCAEDLVVKCGTVKILSLIACVLEILGSKTVL